MVMRCEGRHFAEAVERKIRMDGNRNKKGKKTEIKGKKKNKIGRKKLKEEKKKER